MVCLYQITIQFIEFLLTKSLESYLYYLNLLCAREFSFPRLIVVPLSCYQVDGVRKEKERLMVMGLRSSFRSDGHPLDAILFSLEIILYYLPDVRRLWIIFFLNLHYLEVLFLFPWLSIFYLFLIYYSCVS